MEHLLKAIQAATQRDATIDQKVAGVQACRTIMTALAAEVGKPIALPGAPQPHPLSRLSFDQTLDLVIARLSTVADARDTAAKQVASPTAPRGPQIALVQPPAAPARPAARAIARRKP